MKAFMLLAEPCGLSICFGPVSDMYLIEKVDPRGLDEPLVSMQETLDLAISYVCGYSAYHHPGRRVAFSLLPNPYVHQRGSALFMATCTGHFQDVPG